MKGLLARFNQRIEGVQYDLSFVVDQTLELNGASVLFLSEVPCGRYLQEEDPKTEKQ